MLKALLLDLDGLLVDTERVAIAAWKRAGERLGYVIPDGFVEKYIGKGVEATKLGVLALHGVSVPLEDMRALRIQYGAEIIHRDGVSAMPGAQRLIEVAKQNGVRLAVCTGSPRGDATDKLSLAGIPLEQNFDFMVCREDVQNGKPAPDLFLFAMKRLGVAPHECAVVEDSPAGVEAGLSAGARVMVVPDLVAVPRVRRPQVEMCNSLLDVAARLFGDRHAVRTLHLSLESFDALLEGHPTFGTILRDPANRSLCLNDDVLCAMPPGVSSERGFARATISGLFPYPTYEEMSVSLGGDPAFADYFTGAAPAFDREQVRQWGVLGVFLWPN